MCTQYINLQSGTVSLYIWRTIKILVKLLPVYIRWPTAQQRLEIDPPTRVFRHCIGFLDGSEVALRYKPMVDPEAYYSRKGFYGFNLQAICDWDHRFLWVAMGHTASAHDSPAFKYTPFYKNIGNLFNDEEYILADKAYALEKHIITPYKGRIARDPVHSAFNYALSVPRVKIEHAFGILKARWPSLTEIPVRIGENERSGHEKVLYWTIACVVLHNMLAGMGDNESWLEETVAQNSGGEYAENHNNHHRARGREGEGGREGIERRNNLRDLVAMLE